MTRLAHRTAGRPAVLVVDDEKHVRATLADILTEEGFRVATADTGEKAVRMFSREAFDIVLMDVRMPGMDGIEAFRRIRRCDRRASVIMMSAYSVQELQRTVMDEGAVAFLRKPLDIKRVVQLIGEARAAGRP